MWFLLFSYRKFTKFINSLSNSAITIKIVKLSCIGNKKQKFYFHFYQKNYAIILFQEVESHWILMPNDMQYK
jgi:hypothetical protein